MSKPTKIDPADCLTREHDPVAAWYSSLEIGLEIDLALAAGEAYLDEDGLLRYHWEDAD